MALGIPFLILALIIGIVIITFFAWLIFSGPTVGPLPPFNVIPVTNVNITEDGTVIESLGPVFDTVTFTDDYPESLDDRNRSVSGVLYLDLEVVTIGQTSGLKGTFDLSGVPGNTKSIFSNFTGVGALKPVKVYYFVQNEDSTEKVVINITDNTFVRPGYNYISYFTTAIASDQPNFSTSISTTPYSYKTFMGDTKTGTGVVKGDSFGERTITNSNLSIREKLLSTFRNSPTLNRQNYQLVSLETINNIPSDADSEMLESFNVNGAIINVSGITEYIASAPCQ